MRKVGGGPGTVGRKNEEEEEEEAEGGKEVKVERLTKTACREEGILKKTRGSFYTQQKTRENNLNI